MVYWAEWGLGIYAHRMLEVARSRPVRGIGCTRPIPCQGAGIVLFAIEIVRVDDSALEGAG
jgi:hypothetical protein